VTEAGKGLAWLACGLGARNTLRLEAAMALYGHEISEEINLLESGLERFSKLGKSDFLGSQALLRLQAERRTQAQAGRPGDGRSRHRRDGYKVCSLERQTIGYVTKRLTLALS